MCPSVTLRALACPEPPPATGLSSAHPGFETLQHVCNLPMLPPIWNWLVEVGGQTFCQSAALLNVSSKFKHAILSFYAFQQTTLGIDAVEHRTTPFGMPDLSEPKQRSQVDHGLMVA